MLSRKGSSVGVGVIPFADEQLGKEWRELVISNRGKWGIKIRVKMKEQGPIVKGDEVRSHESCSL